MMNNRGQVLSIFESNQLNTFCAINFILSFLTRNAESLRHFDRSLCLGILAYSLTLVQHFPKSDMYLKKFDPFFHENRIDGSNILYS